jgi:hypothetical protein
MRYVVRFFTGRDEDMGNTFAAFAAFTGHGTAIKFMSDNERKIGPLEVYDTHAHQIVACTLY